MSSTPTYDDEKGGITEIERVESEGGNQAIIDSYTPEEQKRILRKVDLRLCVSHGPNQLGCCHGRWYGC
jgi:hypothetical protein